MRLVLQLALRNIWRQRRRNGLVLFAIVVSIGGVFVMNSLARGMEQDFLTFSIENLRGHIKILAPNQLDEPGLRYSIPAESDWSLFNRPEIEAWTPRLRSPAVIMSERETRGIEVVGIDPSRETHSFIENLVIEGQSISDSTDQHLLIGRDLAEELKTGIGRRLVVLMNGPDDIAIESGFRVRGIFDSTTTRYEEAYVLTGLSSLQTLTGVDGFTEISLHLDDLDQIIKVQPLLATQLPELDVVNWEALDPFTSEMYRFIDFTVYILIVVFLGTLVFGLINALVTAVLVRIKEFGMLRVVGMKSRLVVMQVVIECVIIMFLALVIGLVVGLLFVWWIGDGIDLTAFAAGVEAFGMSARMVPHIVVEDFVILGVASVILGLIASYFPARRVIKTSILQSLRDG
ncbi:MAG: FtsX-like permease family protein [Gammaproteobacteria bacterium]|nr:FtsX-like permease family protein [Gammaproteobacteria bacterium]